MRRRRIVRGRWCEARHRGTVPAVRGRWALVLGVATSIAAAACAPRATRSGPAVPWGATVDAIQANPAQAEGRLVTVSGEVNRVFGPRRFSIGGEGFGGGEELLVVGSSRFPALLDDLADAGRVEDDIVQVTGRVRVFDQRAIEQELGETLGGNWWRLYERQPVLVMTALAVTPRGGGTPAPMAPITIPEPVAPIVDVDVILDTPDPTALSGRAVALLGVTVRSAVGRNALWVGSSADRQLFVALAPAPAIALGIRPGQTVVLAGVLRPAPRDPATARSVWGLSASDAATLARAPLYVRANGLRIVSAEPPAAGVVFPSRAGDPVRPR